MAKRTRRLLPTCLVPDCYQVEELPDGSPFRSLHFPAVPLRVEPLAPRDQFDRRDSAVGHGLLRESSELPRSPGRRRIRWKETFDAQVLKRDVLSGADDRHR